MDGAGTRFSNEGNSSALFSPEKSTKKKKKDKATPIGYIMKKLVGSAKEEEEISLLCICVGRFSWK